MEEHSAECSGQAYWPLERLPSPSTGDPGSNPGRATIHSLQGQLAKGRDPSTIIITGPDGTVVLDVVNAVLKGGAHQAHAS